MDKPIDKFSRQYCYGSFDETVADPDPLRQFDLWFDEATRAGLRDPNAMVLSTVGASGQPSGRMMLLKSYGERGFVFYTNYASQKVKELEANPLAALTFWWPEFERSVRVEGRVSRTTREESEAYFASRPRDSQIGAWASRQSAVIASRAALEDKAREIEARYPGDEVPCPPFWGGFLLVPAMVEFWQGRVSRLHDRLRYQRTPDGGWLRERLCP